MALTDEELVRVRETLASPEFRSRLTTADRKALAGALAVGAVTAPTDRQVREGVRVLREDRERKTQALERMLAGESGGYRSLKQAYADVTGQTSVFDVRAEDVMRESVGFDSAMRSTESVASGTWSFILGDSITRRMVAEYQQPDMQAWRKIVSSTPPVNDFRTQRIERMGGYGVLPGVNQGAPYQPLTSPTNEEVTYGITKRGGTEDLTLETIANDDVRAVQRIPVKLGLAAAQTLFRFVFDLLITNSNVYDGTALFVAGHNNTAAGALSNSNLAAARKGMRKQSAFGDTFDILSLVPRFLLVPPDLEELAFELCTSAVALPTAAPDGGAAGNVPNLFQGMVPIVVDYWSATSTTFWAVVADPNRAPTIEVGFWEGKQDPDLVIQNDPTVGSAFATDKITFKIRHVYSGAVLDFRPFYRGNS